MPVFIHRFVPVDCLGRTVFPRVSEIIFSNDKYIRRQSDKLQLFRNSFRSYLPLSIKKIRTKIPNKTYF